MPDISMCANVECPKAGRCYRFMAEPSERQSYGSFKPDASGQCNAFSELSPAEAKTLAHNAPPEKTNRPNLLDG